MMLLRELRRRGRVIVGPVLGMALTGYFAYNLVEGRGFIAWTRLTQQIRRRTLISRHFVANVRRSS